MFVCVLICYVFVFWLPSVIVMDILYVPGVAVTVESNNFGVFTMAGLVSADPLHFGS